MLIFAMNRQQYVLVRKAIMSYIHNMEHMHEDWGPPKNPYHVMREQNLLKDIKSLQDLLIDLETREKMFRV